MANEREREQEEEGLRWDYALVLLFLLGLPILQMFNEPVTFIII